MFIFRMARLDKITSFNALLKFLKKKMENGNGKFKHFVDRKLILQLTVAYNTLVGMQIMVAYICVP